MDDSGMLDAVRFAAGLPDGHPDYTDARIRTEIYDAHVTFFGEVVLESQANHWLHPTIVNCVANTSLYYIPGRAMLGGLKRIECRASATDDFYTLDWIDTDGVATRDTKTGQPAAFEVQDDFVRVFPTPNSGNYDLRFWFYLRPPKLVQEQTAGVITAFDSSTNIITVNSPPTNRGTESELAQTELCDVVSPIGTHAVHAASLYISSHTLTQSTYTVATSGDVDCITTDLSRIRVGDLLRAADETDYPMLHQEFHRTLADATAAVILAGGIGALQKAGGLTGKVSSDVNRFRDMLQPRVKDTVRKLRPKYGSVRQGRAGYRRNWPVAPSS